jgi:hypothetical protein
VTRHVWWAVRDRGRELSPAVRLDAAERSPSGSFSSAGDWYVDARLADGRDDLAIALALGIAP